MNKQIDFEGKLRNAREKRRQNAHIALGQDIRQLSFPFPKLIKIKTPSAERALQSECDATFYRISKFGTN